VVTELVKAYYALHQRFHFVWVYVQGLVPAMITVTTALLVATEGLSVVTEVELMVTEVLLVVTEA
jgi:hypothetical protein